MKPTDEEHALKLLNENINNLNDYAGEEVVKLLESTPPIYKLNISVEGKTTLYEGYFDGAFAIVNGIKIGITLVEYNIINLTNIAGQVLAEAAAALEITDEDNPEINKKKLN